MPKISKRADSMGESPIRKLIPYAETAKKRGVKVLHLNIGQPDIETPANVLKSLREYDEKIIAYSHSAGESAYRKKLESYYKKFDIEVDEEDILVTNGASEAILFAFLSITDPGDEIIIPEPFYANYNGFAHTIGIKINPINSSIEDNFALPDVAEFERNINERTKAIMICNPNNPTGYVYSEEELEVLTKLAQKHNLFLIADEVYREFVYDGAKFISILAFDELKENAIVIDSISKRFSACGARIGSLVTKNREVIQNALKFAQARLSPPSLGQYIAKATLDTPESYIEEVKAEYKKRRDVLLEELTKIPKLKISQPKGAFYMMVELPVKSAENFCKWMLKDFSDKNQTVMMAPAEGFYSTPSLGKNQVRIAYVLNTEKLKRAAELIKLGLERYED